MRFALDESGSFSLSSAGRTPAVSVAVTLVVPDDEWTGLLSSYRSFRATLAPEEFKDDEPKGGRLTRSSKLAYCEMLSRHPRVQVCPCILDLGQFPDDRAAKLRDGLAMDVRRLSDQVPDADDQRVLEAVGDKICDLSPPQAVRLYTWARSFFYALHFAIVLPDVTDTLTEWDHREFLIDPVQNKPGSDEECIFGEILSLWMVSWSSIRDEHHDWKFVVPDKSECPYHSFRARFFRDDRIDLAAVLSGCVRFDRTSKVEELLQIADIAASIVYRAARKPKPESEVVGVYERLMRSCPFESNFGIGLITPYQELAGAGQPNRFAPLIAAMQRSYRSS